MKLSAELIESEHEFIARCPELDINCYGNDRKEAIRRLKNVIHFYINSAKEFGLEVEGQVAISIEGEPSTDADLPDSINQSTTIN